MDHVLNAQQQQQQGIPGLTDPNLNPHINPSTPTPSNNQPNQNQTTSSSSTPAPGTAGAAGSAQSTPGSPLAIGIHCSNPTCKTRTGDRSRGHQSCRWQLCGHCCQTLAREAVEKGERREVCKVHSRRVHTGHRVLPRDSVGSMGLSVGGTQGVFGLGPIGMEGVGVGVGIGGIGPDGTIGHGDVEEQLEKRTRLEQSLRRSVVVVVWYKSNTPPLHVPLELRTFPLFRFLDFPDLLNELKLPQSGFIDSYNEQNAQWEQHKLSTVKNVDPMGFFANLSTAINMNGSNSGGMNGFGINEPRILYRLRPSLLEALDDASCPGLQEEIALLAPAHMHMQHAQAQAAMYANANANAGTPHGRGVKRASGEEGGGGGKKNKNNNSAQQNQNQTNSPLQITNAGSLVLNTDGKIVQPWTPASGPPAPNSGPQGTPGSGPGGPWDFSSIVMGPTPFGPGGPVTPVHAGAKNKNAEQQQYMPMGIPPPPPGVGVFDPNLYAHPHAHGMPPPGVHPLPHPHPGAPPHPHGHGPQHAKRFPTDYNVAQIVQGFALMTQMQGQNPSIKQREAFERVFMTRYVKSTVGRAKLYWKKAPEGVRRAFLEMGQPGAGGAGVEGGGEGGEGGVGSGVLGGAVPGAGRGMWGEFVRVVDGRGGVGGVSFVENGPGASSGKAGSRAQDEDDDDEAEEDEVDARNISTRSIDMDIDPNLNGGGSGGRGGARRNGRRRSDDDEGEDDPNDHDDEQDEGGEDDEDEHDAQTQAHANVVVNALLGNEGRGVQNILSAERQKTGLDIPQRSSSSLAGAVSPHGHGHMR